MRSALFVVCALCALAPGAARASSPGLVPASWTMRPDSNGFSWDIQQDGQVGDGTNDCFDGAERLTVNGQQFSPAQRLMSPDGTLYVLTGRVGGIEVTRRIKLDVQVGGVRYVEMMRNTGSSPASVTMVLLTHLGGNCASVVSDTTGLAAGLGQGDSGLVAFQYPGQRPSVVFVLASPTSKDKPSVSVNSNRTFTFTWGLTVPAGATTSVCHSIAQRNLAGVPPVKERAELVKPFLSRSWLADEPAEVRRTIVNMRGTGLSGSALPSLIQALEALGVARSASDVLAFGEGTLLKGSASCAGVSAKGAFGRAELPLEKVIALTGERFAGGAPRVYLRDGQVLAGEVAAKGLRFTSASGLSMDLSVGFLDRLVLHESPDDGRPPAAVAAYVDTVDGDRIAVTRDRKVTFTAETPWGARTFTLDELRCLVPLEEGALGHRVDLADRSRFFCFLGGAPVQVSTLNFGTMTFRPAEIRSVTAVEQAPPASGAPERDEIGLPHVVLAGENVFAGLVDLPELGFIAMGQLVAVPPGQIRSLRAEDAKDDSPGERPVFTAEVWGSGSVAGRLRETVLPVRTGGSLLHVPACDVVEVVVPTPAVPEGLRLKVAALIRDLGHAEWKVREKATKDLEETGFLARQQLEDAVKSASDAETKRRVRALLDGMEK